MKPKHQGNPESAGPTPLMAQSLQVQIETGPGGSHALPASSIAVGYFSPIKNPYK